MIRNVYAGIVACAGCAGRILACAIVLGMALCRPPASGQTAPAAGGDNHAAVDCRVSTSSTFAAAISVAAGHTLHIAQTEDPGIQADAETMAMPIPCTTGLVSTTVCLRATSLTAVGLKACAGGVCCNLEVTTICTLRLCTSVHATTLLWCTTCVVTTVTKCITVTLATLASVSFDNTSRLIGYGGGAVSVCRMTAATLCTLTITTCVTLQVCRNETGSLIANRPRGDPDGRWSNRNNRGAVRKARDELRAPTCYPNPVRSRAVIGYGLPFRARVRLVLCSNLGAEIREFVNNIQDPGDYTVGIDTELLPSGVYYYKLSIADRIFVDKLIVTK